MADNGRLIVVSNRLPVVLVREGENWKTKRSAGGLATAMDPILKRAGGVWIGWSGAKRTRRRKSSSCFGESNHALRSACPRTF